MLEQLTIGPVMTNCYIYWDDKTKAGVVVDPAGDCQRILEVIQAHKLNIERILLTHTHYDHIGAVRELAEKTGNAVRRAQTAPKRQPERVQRLWRETKGRGCFSIGRGCFFLRPPQISSFSYAGAYTRRYLHLQRAPSLFRRHSFPR